MDRRALILSLLGGLTLPLVPIKIEASAIKSGRRLILIELSGANDGLNTVVPFSNQEYYKIRPSLSIKENDLLKINDDFGFHNSLKNIAELWDNEELAIVQGLGYPGANRSHFKSIAIWETGGEGTVKGKNGWLTEDIESSYENVDLDAHGISLDGGMGIFTSDNGNWLSMSSIKQFKQVDRSMITEIGKSQNPMLELLISRSQEMSRSMSQVSKKLDESAHRGLKVRAGDLGNQLSRAAQLIAAGIKAPVLKVKMEGFDTHADQLGRQKMLLKRLAKGISEFSERMKEIDQWDKILLFTYSEFGRRAAENTTGGTDHGTAAPHFLTGGKVNGGLFGKHPQLDDLENGDLKFTTDYRSIYELILNKWFSLPNNKFKRFKEKTLHKIIKA